MGGKITLECLESLYQINYPNYDIIVVDNGSSDGSIKKIRDYCKGILHVDSPFHDYQEINKPISLFEYDKNDLDDLNRMEDGFENLVSANKLLLIKNDKNYGYAEGNNIGMGYVMKYLSSDYILLLNNDTVVDVNFLGELVETCESTPNVGCVGPKVYYYDYNGRRDVISFAGEKIDLFTSRGRRFGKDQIDGGQFNTVSVTDKVEGCCMLIKRDVIEKVGMFDPVYFAYWEETDLCMRMKNHGYILLFVPTACVWHKIGVTWENYFGYFVLYHYLVRNRLIFISRYASAPQKLVFSVFFIFYLMANMVLMLVKEDWQTSKEGFKAVNNGIKDFKQLKKIEKNNYI